ncbi:hypothetical protein [uncultured Psychrobacter sp.]|uniref:hypothetical protein n=1 Tax=uncultured Psychrobacter sp. TaxID=259303 RepID=UPI0026387A96|nr:hypothetical protein [uncultured Psychrobacter sp.]
MSNLEPYYYTLETTGFPSNVKFVNMPADFKIYLLCDTPDKRQVCIYQDRNDFRDSNSKEDKNVQRLFLTLSKKLSESENVIELMDLYDDKELHPAHYTKIDSNKKTVYRIRKGGVRVYFVIIGSDIILFRLSIKLQNKINKSEESIIDSRVKAIFSCPPHENQFLKRVL